MEGPPIFKELEREECLRHLAQVPLGRVAVHIGALPAIRSVRFALTSDHVVFRVGHGSQLRRALGGVVAFQADHYEPVAMKGWAVHILGTSEEVSDPEEVVRLQALPLEAWAFSSRGDHFFQLSLSSMTGERIHWPIASTR